MNNTSVNAESAAAPEECAATVCCGQGASNYLVVVAGPILLSLCTIGNVLNIAAILLRAGQIKVRDILILSMAAFDFLTM